MVNIPAGLRGLGALLYSQSGEGRGRQIALSFRRGGGQKDRQTERQNTEEEDMIEGVREGALW